MSMALHEEIILDLANGSHATPHSIKHDRNCFTMIFNKNYGGDGSLRPPISACSKTFRFTQKLTAEFMGTYLLLLTGFAAGVVNKDLNNLLTFPGLALLWGLDVMVMIYAVGHISGAHFNPAVTIAFASTNRFAWKQVPAYISVQLMAAMLASGTVQMIFGGKPMDHFVGTVPAGSSLQSLMLEFIITFYLMFAVSGCATDDHSVGELGGIALGATVTINSFIAGPISGASMNPARSLGPAIVFNYYKGIWIYIVGPTFGALAGVWFYNIVRLTNKPSNHIIKLQQTFLTQSGQDSPQAIGPGQII